MKLRTFTAKTTRTALRAVKDALGADAVIISTVTLANGWVEVRAAGEHKAEPETLADALLPIEADVPPGPIAEIVLSHGFDTGLAARLTPEQGGFAAWAETLCAALRFDPLPVCGAPVLLIGPSGVGKTLLAAKLAARARLDDLSVTLVCSDPDRMGEQTRLEGYAEAMNATPAAAVSPKAIAQFARVPCDLVVIDGPALNPFDANGLAHINDMITLSGAEPILVMPASGDTSDMTLLVRAAKALGVRRVVITKCDLTARMASSITAVVAADLAIGGFAHSAFLGQGLLRAEGATLARILIHTHQLAHATDIESLLPATPPEVMELSLETVATPTDITPIDLDHDLFGDAA
jgi:flagellar biosynthesis protein FlhF